MIGAGGQAGQDDAANLLKPALARGELRTIAATTWSEYKKYFEKDAALARRFQVVKVEEPSEHQCLIMMRGLVASLEKHHNVRILDEAVFASVRLSHRFLAGRQLPDKAVSILDTACARLSLGQNATPPALEDPTRQIDALDVQKRILDRETVVGATTRRSWPRSQTQRTAADAKLKALQERWDKERELVAKIRELREKLEARPCGERDSRAGPPALPTSSQAGTAGPGSRARRAAGRDRPDPGLRGRADCRRGAFRLDRHSRRQDAQGRNRHRAGAAGASGQARHRAASCHGDHQPAGPDLARISRRSQQAGRRFHAGWAQRRGQDGDRARAFRPALRRRAQPDHHQYVGVSGAAYRFDAEGIASGLRGLRRRRRADRSGAAPALFGGAAGRSGKGSSRRAGALLPGLRQGQHGGRRRPPDRLQEQHHHPDDQRLHRPDDEAGGRSGDRAQPARAWSRPSSRT